MRKLSLLIIGLLGVCFSYAALAKIDCTPLPSDVKNFNTSNFQDCLKLIQQCPKTGSVYDANCIDQKTSTNKVCAVTQILASQLQISADQLSVVPINHFVILTVTFPADGQLKYYLLSPQACLIDTAIDPRSVDSKSFPANLNLVITNASFPVYQHQHNSDDIFTVLLQIQQDCLACKILGKKQIKFIFDGEGNFIKAEDI